MTRKNILLITTDQQSATMLSCTGNPDVQTPNLDALAADGVRFEKAYAAQPLCVQQRSTWYTGLMPHEHGITFNAWGEGQTVKADVMMGQIFRDAGFATGCSGKWHVVVPVEDVARHGFEWTSNIRNNGADKEVATDFETFLRETDERPFLFSASFNNPHNICESARGVATPDGYHGLPENLDQLPPLPDNFAIPEREPSVLRETQKRHWKQNYPTGKWDAFRWRLHRWMYARMVEMVDRHIGDVLQVLRERGHWEDTLIVFASDHGDGNAHHQWNQKQVLYDESARVPFLVCAPGSGTGRVDETQLVNAGIDLIPTLCGLAGVPVPGQLAGQDWSGALAEPEMPLLRDHLIVETEFGTYGKPDGNLGRAVRTPRYKYMVYSSGENREFFVDMDQDPGETLNLVGDAAHQVELDRHRALLRDYIEARGDIFPLERVGRTDTNMQKELL